VSLIGSPFQFTVGPISDVGAHKVRAIGPGLEKGQVLVPSWSIDHILSTLEGKYSLESTDPRESEIRAPRQLTIALKLSYYLFIIADLFIVKDGCLKFVYIGKNSRFTALLDSNLHTRLAIVTENELGLSFPPRNLPKKIRP